MILLKAAAWNDWCKVSSRAEASPVLREGAEPMKPAPVIMISFVLSMACACDLAACGATSATPIGDAWSDGDGEGSADAVWVGGSDAGAGPYGEVSGGADGAGAPDGAAVDVPLPAGYVKQCAGAPFIGQDEHAADLGSCQACPSASACDRDTFSCAPDTCAPPAWKGKAAWAFVSMVPSAAGATCDQDGDGKPEQQPPVQPIGYGLGFGKILTLNVAEGTFVPVLIEDGTGRLAVLTASPCAGLATCGGTCTLAPWRSAFRSGGPGDACTSVSSLAKSDASVGLEAGDLEDATSEFPLHTWSCGPLAVTLTHAYLKASTQGTSLAGRVCGRMDFDAYQAAVDASPDAFWSGCLAQKEKKDTHKLALKASAKAMPGSTGLQVPMSFDFVAVPVLLDDPDTAN